MVKQDNNILYIALGTAVLLLFPYLAMQFNWSIPDPGSQVQNGVNWSTSDFIIMGILLFSTGVAFDFVMKALRNSPYRVHAAIAIILGFLYIWAELAVGVFTNIGS